MEVEFRTNKLERAYARGAEAEKQWGKAIGRKYVQRIKLLAALSTVLEVQQARALVFHGLEGKYKGQYGITLTANWRLIVSLPDGEEGDRIRIDEVDDYHGR